MRVSEFEGSKETYLTPWCCHDFSCF